MCSLNPVNYCLDSGVHLKANNLDPYKYLRYLFEKLPFVSSEMELADLLPMNLRPEDLLLQVAATGV